MLRLEPVTFLGKGLPMYLIGLYHIMHGRHTALFVYSIGIAKMV